MYTFIHYYCRTSLSLGFQVQCQIICFVIVQGDIIIHYIRNIWSYFLRPHKQCKRPFFYLNINFPPKYFGTESSVEEYLQKCFLYDNDMKGSHYVASEVSAIVIYYLTFIDSVISTQSIALVRSYTQKILHHLLYAILSIF